MPPPKARQTRALPHTTATPSPRFELSKDGRAIDPARNRSRLRPPARPEPVLSVFKGLRRLFRAALSEGRRPAARGARDARPPAPDATPRFLLAFHVFNCLSAQICHKIALIYGVQMLYCYLTHIPRCGAAEGRKDQTVAIFQATIISGFQEAFVDAATEVAGPPARAVTAAEDRAEAGRLRRSGRGWSGRSPWRFRSGRDRAARRRRSGTDCLSEFR